MNAEDLIGELYAYLNSPPTPSTHKPLSSASGASVQPSESTNLDLGASVHPLESSIHPLESQRTSTGPQIHPNQPNSQTSSYHPNQTNLVNQPKVPSPGAPGVRNNGNYSPAPHQNASYTTPCSPISPSLYPHSTGPRSSPGPRQSFSQGPRQSFAPRTALAKALRPRGSFLGPPGPRMGGLSSQG